MMEQKITAQTFADAKTMLKYGMTQKAVAEKIGCSENTIWLVNKVEDYEAYQKYRHERKINHKKPETRNNRRGKSLNTSTA